MKHSIIIFGVGILIRIGSSIPVLTDCERSFGFGADSYCYDKLAKRMIEYKKFSVYPENSYLPEPARTPGYPCFLYIVYKFFGSNQWIVTLFQAIVDSIVGVLIFSLLSIINFSRIGFVAGLLYALNLHQALYTTQILTEIIFTFFLFLSISSILWTTNKYKNYRILVSGFLLGVATFIRAIALYFPFLICIWLLINHREKISLRSKKIGLFGVSFITTILPWIIRNYICFDKFFFSIMGDINIAHFNAAPVIARIEKIPESKAREKIIEFTQTKYGLSEEEIALFGDKPEISKLMKKVGIDIIRRYPGIYLQEHLLGFMKVFLHSELAYWGRLFYGYKRERLKSMAPISKTVLRLIFRGNILQAIKLAYNKRFKWMPNFLIFIWLFTSLFELALYVFSFFGIKYLIRKTHLLLLFIFVIFYFSFIPGPVGDGRFRVPIEPYISILAGCGIVYLWTRRRCKNS
jgi:4-amino-4-deoxy-L-arabinose transferase-like glycosyltransferase